MLVDKRVYLDVSHAEKFLCEPGQEIYRLIVECPRKANGNHYKMDWQAFKEDLPIGLDPVCLREYLPKSKEMKAWLLEGVEKFQEEERLGLAPKSKKGQNKNASKKRPAKAAPALPSTPPPAVRFAKRAALMTAADSTSVSSLSGRTFASGSSIPTVTTGSVGSRTRPPTRRATLEDDSDSDGLVSKSLRRLRWRRLRWRLRRWVRRLARGASLGRGLAPPRWGPAAAVATPAGVGRSWPPWAAWRPD